MSEPTATPVVETSAIAAPQEKRSKKPWLLFAAGTVPLLLGGVVFFATRGPSADAEHGAPERKPKEKPGVLAIEPFVVNLGSEQGRFLKCSVRVALASAETTEKIQGEPLTLLRIQDAMLSVLSTSTVQDLAATGGKEALRRSLMKHVQEVLGENPVEDIYFTEFLFQ